MEHRGSRRNDCRGAAAPHAPHRGMKANSGPGSSGVRIPVRERHVKGDGLGLQGPASVGKCASGGVNPGLLRGAGWGGRPPREAYLLWSPTSYYSLHTMPVN